MNNDSHKAIIATNPGQVQHSRVVLLPVRDVEVEENHQNRVEEPQRFHRVRSAPAKHRVETDGDQAS